MKFRHFLICGLLGLAAVANANVSVEMFQMNRQMGTLLYAESSEAFRESAKTFIEAAEKARDKLPKSLSDEQDRFDDYQKAMQELIDTVKQADQLAEQGKLDEAKEVAKRLNQLKKVGHNEYK